MIIEDAARQNERVIVLVPVYNEYATVVSVLDRILAQGIASEILVVDDGSSDGTGSLLDGWGAGHAGVTILRHPSNQGYSKALLTGFLHLISRMDGGTLTERHIVATVDADGQHDPAQLGGFVQTMKDQGLDVLWARRDFSLYPAYKRWGNSLMALIGGAFAGIRFRDVESGYCLFRLGPLRHALGFGLRDRRYSISLTLAVLLGRLGYRISNEPLAHVPVYRSRTRIVDVFLDTRAAFAAWFAVEARRPGHAARLALAFSVLALTAALSIAVASKRVYEGFDSINNYAHVWYIFERMYDGEFPLRFANLEGGHALTFPYGFIPWTVAALARPVAGDYAVTWLMVAAFVSVLAVVYATRLGRNLWLLALYLLIPFVAQVLLNFQMSFAWALLFGFLYARAIDRHAMYRAAVWLGAALITHLLVMGPILALYTAWQWRARSEVRPGLTIIWALAVAPIAFLAWHMWHTPAVSQAPLATVTAVTIGTVASRGVVFFTPFVLKWLADHPRLAWRQATGAAGALVLVAVTVPWNLKYASHYGLTTPQNVDYAGYLASESFVRGATYRLGEAPGHEIGQYEFIQHGAVLDGEFFDESRYRREWTPAGYSCFLQAKEVDFVLVTQQYENAPGTNERALLDQLVAQGYASMQYIDPGLQFRVYDVKGLEDSAEPRAVRQCLTL